MYKPLSRWLLFRKAMKAIGEMIELAVCRKVENALKFWSKGQCVCPTTRKCIYMVSKYPCSTSKLA